ncbi:MAG: TonB system transport protein ExbD [Candidatus Thiothrix singaporensis]|uniref:Biopolymer transport protein ExbD n=1 Tax=Candidatus Thiothrix singaporensis TaxID=2799669 RepID=A0A7L6AU79_9GAMM|nr:MAG: TonB system transport protein ExbD [Candidatus Thiothrix singaporensis]
MKRFDQINMIPFIDIMLVLLAIVLTTATFVSQGLIEVNLPTAEQVSEPSEDEDPLEIAINAQNQLFLAGEAVDLPQLGAKLDAQAKPDTLIVLRIDKAAVFEHFVKLIDLLKAKELNNLSIQAQQEP